MSKSGICGAIAAAAVLHVSLACVAAAQGSPAGAGNATSDNALEEVVVTAQRREESLQKSSVAIDVLSARQLDRAGVNQAADLTRVLPGVQVGQGGSAAQVYIRGVGDYGATSVSNPAVAFNVDGVYLARTQAISGSFFDLARVEVLKGPQGTLYGRNASGGAINLIAQVPELGKNSGYAMVTGQNERGIEGEGAVNVALGSTLAVRLATQAASRDGYISDGSDDDKHASGRVQLLWQPNEDFSTRFWGSYSHSGGVGPGFVLLDRYGNPTIGRPGSHVDPWTSIASPAGNAIIAAGNAGLAGAQGPSPTGSYVDPFDPARLYQDMDFWNVHLESRWDMKWATLTVIPAYQHARMAYRIYSGLSYETTDTHGNAESSGATSLEVRLAHGSERIKWVAGIYDYDENQTSPSTIDNGFLQRLGVLDTARTHSAAAFGQLTYSLTQALRLIGGIRYTNEHKTLEGTRTAFAPSTSCFPGPGPCPLGAIGGVTQDDAVNYRAGLEYDLAPQSMLFFTAATGFKSGGLSQAVTAPYKPEKLTAYTLGSRNRFLGDSLQVNLEAFYWDYADHQELVIGPDDLGAVAAIIRNAGTATIYGSSVDLTWQLTRTDQLRAGAEYTHSRYDSFNYQTPTATLSPGSTGCRVSATGQLGPIGPISDVDCSGFQLARSPTWSGLAGYSHQFELPGAAALSAGVDMTFASSRWLSVDFIPNARAAGYTLWNADLAYVPGSGGWQLSAFVRNIGNRAVYTGGAQNSFIAGLYGANIGPPRTYGARVRFDF